MGRSDHALRERCLKFEGNNDLRVQAFVVRLSRLSTPELQAICGRKMCNERRAAEKVLAWRAANPNFKPQNQEHRPPNPQAGGGKSHSQTGFFGCHSKSKRKHRRGPGQGPRTESARAGHDPRPASGYQQRAASVMPVVIAPSTPCRLDLPAMEAEHRRLCAMKGIRTRSFANAQAVPFPYTDGSSLTPLPSTDSGLASPKMPAPSENAKASVS